MNWLKKLTILRLIMMQVEKADYAEKLVKLEIKYLVIIMTNILILKNLTS